MGKKYYVEIFAIDKTIIYGYAISTDIEEFDWSIKRIKIKSKVYVNKFASVISKQKLEELKKDLKNETVSINSNIIETGLYEEECMLNINDKSNLTKNEIINKLSHKNVLWKLDKKAILSKINNIFNNDKFKENIINVSDKIQEEIGLSLSRNIEKVGNFEIYNVIQNDIFRNYVNNTNIVVEKINKFDKAVIINITYWNGDEVKSNNIYTLKKHDNKISIEALDSVSRVRVIIWNQQDGEIIYFYDEYIMQSLHMTMNMVTSIETIKDEWSGKLRNSSSNLSKDIDSIEYVSKYMQHKNNIGMDKDIINKTKEESRKIQKSLITKKENGCFIDKSNDKESEIKCLKKIQEYLQEGNVKKCIILDPFFSIVSASKLLTRIEKTNFHLEVIFSLYKDDPDTGKENNNILIDYRKFIQKNENFLHGNLKLINILSGKNQAFHDRYLIREFEDGHKDGFLLSNSINSMGQKYPFVIAPFEENVLNEVIEYVEKIKTHKSYSTEVLYDSKEKYKNDNPKKYINELEILSLYKKVSLASESSLDIFEKLLHKNEQEDFRKILKENSKDIVEFFIKECLSNNFDAFKSISLLMYISNDISDEIFNNFYDYGLKTDNIINYLIEILLRDNENEGNKMYISIKQKLERLCDNKNEITTEEFSYVKKVFRSMVSEYQVNNKYAMQLIRLLSKIEPEKLITLISKTKSPLAYVNLIYYLITKWNETMFKQLLQCNIVSFKELGYSYAYQFIEKSDDKINFINQILLILKEYKYELLAFTLAMIDENKSEDLKELKEYSLIELTNYINESSINSHIINRLFFLLNSTDKRKSILNLFQLKEALFDNKIKKEINENILSEIKDLYKDKYNHIYQLDKDNIILYIGAYCLLELKNNILTTDDLSDALIKENFMILGNPYLKDINYDKWNTIHCKFLINFIFKAYLLDNYNGENKRELVNIMVNELNILMAGLRRINNEYSIIILAQVIAIVAEWIRINYIHQDIKIRLYHMTPDWAKMIFLLNGKEFNTEDIEALINRNIKFDIFRENQFIVSTIGEYIVLREKLEKNIELKEYFKKLRYKFIKDYLNNEEYSKYLELLANDGEFNNTEWKIRGFGFEKLVQ